MSSATYAEASNSCAGRALPSPPVNTVANLAQETEIASEIDRLRGEFPKTQDLYREVCVQLFCRYGITPTTNRLYQLVKKVSMSAPGEALTQF